MRKIILDAHFDVLLDVLHFRKRGERRVLERRHLDSLLRAEINALICSVFIMDDLLPEGALRNALDQISALNEEIDESGRYFSLCRDTKEARAAIEDGRIAIFLSLEGAEPIGGDILLLRTFHELGVRLLGISWSRRNYAADGSAFDWSDSPRTPGGLTKFGKDLLARAQKLKMVIDVSHLNDAGFYETAELAEAPFIASHSNCRALCGTARNLTDDQMRVVARSGGVIGMNAYAPFSSDLPEERTPEKLLAHLDHAVNIAGAEHVGLGLDLCDCIKSLKAERERQSKNDLFANHEEAAKKFIEPIRERYPEDISDMILGGNFFRVLEKTLG
jgi:membrane dipeptidase